MKLKKIQGKETVVHDQVLNIDKIWLKYTVIEP